MRSYNFLKICIYILIVLRTLNFPYREKKDKKKGITINVALRFFDDQLPDISMVSTTLEQDKIHSLLLNELAKHHSHPFLSRGTNSQHFTMYCMGIKQ